MATRSIHALHLALVLASTLGMVGCEDRSTPPENPSSTSPPPPANRTPDTTPKSTPATSQPDNTARNERDRGTAAPTPTDQGETEADRRITADIRKSIMAEKNVSVNAQNCKIITKGGIVTLRGPVSSQAEKDMIAEKAKAAAGVASVVNELEVAPPK